jgi:hypothetical protein
VDHLDILAFMSHRRELVGDEAVELRGAAAVTSC